MIGNLIFEAPHIWKLIRDQLIGNGGQPDALGNAVSGFVRQTEVKHNAQAGSYWYRFFRADDPMVVGGAALAHTYDAVLSLGAGYTVEEHLMAMAVGLTIPTGEAMASFGWICQVDLGRTGYLHVKKEGVLKSEIPARVVYRQQHPEHYYFDLDTVIFAQENAKVDYVIYNGNAFDVTDVCIPIMFRIASRAALNLEKPFY